MMRTLTMARYSMWADILKPGDKPDDPIDPDQYGEWVDNQDPLTGEIVKVWVPFPDDPNTPPDEHVEFGTIPCMVRGLDDGGTIGSSSGNTEQFGATYYDIETVKMWCPPTVNLTKADRVTNIRDKNGHVIWRDEEFPGTPRATLFNVQGVTPLLDAFNNVNQYFVLLSRAEVQDES